MWYCMKQRGQKDCNKWLCSLSIIVLINQLATNVDQSFKKVTSSNVLFCPQHKDIQLTVVEE